jgi:hypothetical protein
MLDPAILPMIQVELGREVSPGAWEWRVTSTGGAVEGRSHQPLLDACRALERMGEPPARLAAMYWPGQSDWALRCSIGWGARLTAADPPSEGMRFRTYRPPHSLRLAVR